MFSIQFHIVLQNLNQSLALEVCGIELKEGHLYLRHTQWVLINSTTADETSSLLGDQIENPERGSVGY